MHSALFIFLWLILMGWLSGLCQKSEGLSPWWRARFCLSCQPHEHHTFWLTAGRRRGYTWERSAAGAQAFPLWHLPRALCLALHLGARWREIRLTWL